MTPPMPCTTTLPCVYRERVSTLIVRFSASTGQRGVDARSIYPRSDILWPREGATKRRYWTMSEALGRPLGVGNVAES